MNARPPLLVAAALLALASPAAAQPVGGVLPLKHGFYVAQGTSCSLPANAMLQSYDGRGLGDPHSSQCRLKVLSRHGKVVTASNSCLDAGVGPAPRSSETVRMRLDGRDRYALLSPNSAPAPFRWCPTDAVLKGR